MAKQASLSDELGKAVQGLASSAGKLAVAAVTDKLTKATGRLTEYAATKGGPGLLSAVTGGKGGVVGAVLSHGLDKAKQAVFGGGDGNGGGGGSKGKQLKVTNIVERLDIGAPVRLCYDQWTQFEDFPTFMKKVETVKQESDEKLNWRAQIFMSHRAWNSTIIEQVPDRRIVWRSEGAKGHVDGAVTFHELAPELTRIMMVLEYYPKGLFEKTGNLWRAQGRRARLELKHFARHVTAHAVLHPEEIQGWRGEIHDGEVTPPEEVQQRDENQQGEENEQGEENQQEEDESAQDESAQDESAQDESAEDEEQPEDQAPPKKRNKKGKSRGDSDDD